MLESRGQFQHRGQKDLLRASTLLCTFRKSLRAGLGRATNSAWQKKQPWHLAIKQLITCRRVKKMQAVECQSAKSQNPEPYSFDKTCDNASPITFPYAW